MLAANASKSVLPNITVILNVLSENGCFCMIELNFSRSQILLISQKHARLRAHADIWVKYYVTSIFDMVQHIHSHTVNKDVITL